MFFFLLHTQSSIAAQMDMPNEPRDQGEVRVAPKTTTAREVAMLPLSMLLVQLITVGVLLLSKLALNDGMSPFVIIVYRNLIASAVVAPLAVIFERYLALNYFINRFVLTAFAFLTILYIGDVEMEIERERETFSR